MLNELLKLNHKIGTAEIEKVPTRKGYGEGLVDLGKWNPNIVVLTGDLAESTTAHLFQREFPDRFIECGVAEQNMMGLAAGLALAGKIPFISSYAVFSPGRSWDQLRVSVCYSQANVKIAGAHTGISVGPDGATHQALEDIAITRVLPGLTVIVPADYIQTKKTTLALGKTNTPAYFRFARNATPVFTSEETPFEIGKAQVLKEGSDITIIGCGPVVYNALVAALELEKEGISVCVVNNHTIKPLDKETILGSVEKSKIVVTLEEHQINGGMGSAICELLSEFLPKPVIRLGIDDRFGESGEPEELIAQFGLDTASLLKRLKELYKIII